MALLTQIQARLQGMGQEVKFSPYQHLLKDFSRIRCCPILFLAIANKGTCLVVGLGSTLLSHILSPIAELAFHGQVKLSLTLTAPQPRWQRHPACLVLSVMSQRHQGQLYTIINLWNFIFFYRLNIPTNRLIAPCPGGQVRNRLVPTHKFLSSCFLLISFCFFLKILFIFFILSLCWASFIAASMLSLVAVEGWSLVVVWASHRGGLSCLQSTGSGYMGFSSCGGWAYLFLGVWNLPGRIEPVSLHCQADSWHWTTGKPFPPLLA